MRDGRRRLVAATCALLALGSSAALASIAGAADFGVADWRAQVFADDMEDETHAWTEHGTGVYDQAGGHPYKGITDFTFRLDESGDPAGGNVKDLRVDIAPGLVPNPELIDRCTDAQFASGTCPNSSQIGIEELTIKDGAAVARIQVPLYNLTISDDQVSRFGLHPADVAPLVPQIGGLAGLAPVFIIGGVRDQPSSFGPNDDGLFFTIDDTPESPSLVGSKLTFWGVPGDPVHDAQRDQACATVLEPVALPPTCVGGGANGADPDLPFLTNPTRCSGVKEFTRLSVFSHLGASDTILDGTPTIEGKEGAQHCERVPFAAQFDVVPDTSQPDAPTGPTTQLRVPQPGLADKDLLTTSHVRDVLVTLPPGLTINPSAANGLQACADAQLDAGVGTPGGDECPAASMVGTVKVTTPLLPAAPALTGSAFVGQPLSGDRYRLFLTIEGRGVSIRMKGSIVPNPSTGQLTAVFRNNPQLPFDALTVDFRDGPLAPLAMPLGCGRATSTSSIVPYSGNAPATPSSTIGVTCSGTPFGPGFGIQQSPTSGGSHSTLAVALNRPDGHQFLSGVAIDMPPGVSGVVAGVPRCPGWQAATGDCPAGSRVGTATVLSGAGAQPFSISGPVYLTGSYRGAPFGLAIVIRAIAGPFDLGTVVVRQALFIDKTDAHLTVVSDPLPTILEGVPIRLRHAGVTIDRPNFTVNPTSCAPLRAVSTLTSTSGAQAQPAAGLQATRCTRLPLKPKLKLKLTKRSQTKDGGHPGVIATLTQKRGESNIKQATVRLPLSLALDPNNAQKLCEYTAGLKEQCPKASIIGRATASSPLLDQPLKGSVYFVKGVRVDPRTGRQIKTLPTLLIPLKGQAAVTLRASTAVVRGQLVNTFAALPDVPLSRFDLKITGGKHGIVVVTLDKDVCKGKQLAKTEFVGHNGKVTRKSVGITRPCKAKKKKK